MVTAADDSFHPPGSNHPWWTETSMYSFDIPERNISAVIYPYIRPNLGIATLHVYVWDDAGIEPRDVLYGLSRWHLPMPAGDLTELELAGLRYRTVEPMRVFTVHYDDGDRLRLDLRYEGFADPHVEFDNRGRGHVDQPCHVTGTVVLDGERIALDGYAMRDRSWVTRPDDFRDVKLAYTFGIKGPEESFLLVSTGQPDDTWTFRGGFCVRDGHYARLVDGRRRVTRSAGRYPVGVELELTDTAGRTLVASGPTRNRLAYPTTAGMFSWLSLVEWEVDGERYHGEDQEAWAYDLLQRTRTDTVAVAGATA